MIRRATRADIRAIVALLNADEMRRSAPEDLDRLPAAYGDALDQMHDDNAFYVAEIDGRIVGCFQLTFIRQFAPNGALVAQVETVQVLREERSKGIGEKMMRWAIDRARERKCLRVQLTSNKKRSRAHAFYERLGFERSHEGMKLWLE